MTSVMFSKPVVAAVAGAVGVVTGRYLSQDITYQELSLPPPPHPPPPPPSTFKSFVRPQVSSIAQSSRAGQILAFGLPQPPAPGPIVYTNHVLEYDSARKVPKWVAEHLTRHNVEQVKANRKGVKFDRDPAIPAMFSSDNTDYFGSGWSRGHMAPAGDNKHCQESMKDTFLLTNIVPQDLDNNGGYWNRLEIWCRGLTKSYQDVWVISGPMWLPVEAEQKEVTEASGGDSRAGGKRRSEVRTVQYPVLGAGQVAVPTHLYKIVLVTDPGIDQPLLGCFIVPNIPIADKHLGKFQVKLEDIERSVGVIFHPSLERSKVGDLCVGSGCNLQDYTQFMHFFWSRRLRSPWNVDNLEKDWTAVKESGLADQELEQIYNESKSHLVNKEKLKGGSEKKFSKEISASVAGA